MEPRLNLVLHVAKYENVSQPTKKNCLSQPIGFSCSSTGKPALRRDYSPPVSCGIQTLPGGAQIAQCKGHARVPRRCAVHLRRVIGYDDAVEIVPFQDPQNSWNIHVTFVNKRLLVERCFATNVAQVHISQPALSTAGVHRIIKVALAHLCQRANTEFKGIRRTGIQVNHLLIESGLINQPGLATHRRHRRVIGM